MLQKGITLYLAVLDYNKILSDIISSDIIDIKISDVIIK